MPLGAYDGDWSLVFVDYISHPSYIGRAVGQIAKNGVDNGTFCSVF